MGTVGYRAVIAGATGAVGSALLGHLLASARCTGVIALGRRAPEVTAAKLSCHVVEMADLQQATADLAAGCTTAFCTVGVGQTSKVSRDEHWLVDVEYAGAFARGAKAAGAEHIALLSAVGTSERSWLRFSRVKAAAEKAVVAAGITRTSLFRPSMIVTPVARYGWTDWLGMRTFPLVSWALPGRYHQIRLDELARAMLAEVELPDRPPGVGVVEFPRMRALLRQVTG